MYQRLVILLLFFPFIAFGQINDDFSDGDFTKDPEWIGDTDKFIVNENYQLQLYDTEAGESYLATENSRIDNTQWEFWVRLAFTPSNNNHPRIYLVADQSDMHGEINGYFIRIGKDGTDNKRIYFYRQDGTSVHELLEGDQNVASGTNNLLRIKVIRDNNGNWEFWADSRGGDLYLPQGSVFDNTYSSTEWFGLFCRYTATNSDRFYFDDIYVGDIIPDIDPPKVLRLNVVDPNILDVHFSKVVEVGSAENVNNYTVDQGIGSPMIANRNPEAPNIVRLMFEQNFTENNLYKITIENIEDLAGNMMEFFEGEFIDFVAQRFDVVFNELMVNTTPVVELPPHEFIELYNTTEFEIDVEGWHLQDHTGIREISYAIIPPKGYLVLTTENGYEELSAYGNVVAVPGFTSSSVTHGGSELVLYDDNDYLISTVYYSDEWYRDPAKDDGGWSLEKIDPYNFCAGKDNWRASEDQRGGTPGETNSIRDENPNIIQPDLVRAGYIDSDTIILFFSEPMDEYSLTNEMNYHIYHESHDIGNPLSVMPVPPAFRKVKLALPENLQTGLIYQVDAEKTLTDCAGNKLDKNIVQVAVPEPADTFDVVINEILFNPPGATSNRYIELYNRSDKTIDLKDYKITSKDTVENYLTTVQDISDESYLFFPGEYVVITTNPGGVKKHYMTTNPYGFIRIGTMPRMTNAGGIAVFASKSLEIIDMVVYTEDMHYALLTTKKGVALERRNYHRPSDSKSNWHSAAENVGFGTPGYRNSQFTHEPEVIEDNITIYPEIFSPNSDGHDDVLNIYFKFDEPGFTANITVYDSRGRLTKKVVRSRLLGTDDVITWDGSTDDNQKANIGIYVIFIELFDPDGNVRRYKKSAVLAGRL